MFDANGMVIGLHFAGGNPPHTPGADFSYVTPIGVVLDEIKTSLSLLDIKLA